MHTDIQLTTSFVSIRFCFGAIGVFNQCSFAVSKEEMAEYERFKLGGWKAWLDELDEPTE